MDFLLTFLLWMIGSPAQQGPIHQVTVSPATVQQTQTVSQNSAERSRRVATAGNTRIRTPHTIIIFEDTHFRKNKKGSN
ncbi:hypothetical protein [Pontibacter sp. G13]|uniref:hypothetical protein n=1 Tax=Pontibacter sp. G13 TaxID=3074898 RepID=UPI00288B465B|nr:hypothetical protein [Pontibacter sp. G13]WNJ20160.1 hypothetical protein RJD25_06745 [Pontibacter sp. G13]